MGWFDKLRGRKGVSRVNDDVTREEHERHLEQSANPGTAPVVPPDTSEEREDAEEKAEQAREEPTGQEERAETQRREDLGGRSTPQEPPRSS